jgi:hypothetical protein
MKHLLNNLSSEEKNRIREQYEGGMSVDTSKFRSLLESKLGDAKPLIKESEEFGDIDMSNLQNEIKDFVLTYGNVSNNATDEEIVSNLWRLRSSEDSDVSRQAIRLTRRL